MLCFKSEKNYIKFIATTETDILITDNITTQNFSCSQNENSASTIYTVIPKTA
jgi:hypothetical protein